MHPVILCIETGGFFPSVSLTTSTQEYHLSKQKERYQHSAVLHEMIDEILTKANLTFKDLNAISINEGPGSYTGLRVGVSCAKTYAYALNIPLIALSSLQIQAAKPEFIFSQKNIVSTLLARKQEVFIAEYNPELKEINPCEAVFFNQKPLPASYFEDKIIVGDGIPVLKELGLTTGSMLVEEPTIVSNHMLGLSLAKYQQQQFEDVLSFVPNYQKDFVAYQ